MSNISRLENFISSYKTYEEVSNYAREIDKNWRSETWTRALRGSKKIKPVYKGVERKSPIIASPTKRH